MSDDEFDDLDPSLFNDPSILASVSKLETAHQTASQLQKPAPTQGFQNVRYHHSLHKPKQRGRPAPIAEAEDDYDSFPDIGVDEDGHYELKDTRYPTGGRLNAVAGPSRLPPVNNPHQPQRAQRVQQPPARHAPPPVRSNQLGNRAPLARSVSMGSQTLSQGSINRMNAIRQASQSPVLGSQATQGIPLPAVPRKPIDDSAAVTQIKAMEQQMQSMKEQLQALQKARDAEAEERRKAENNIYAFKGEAENMRRAVEEAKAKHKQDVEAWRLKNLELGKQIVEKEAETKNKLDAMSSNMAFKTHNIMQSASRPRPVAGGTPQSQARLPPPRFGISTPGKATPRKGPMLPGNAAAATPLGKRGNATPARTLRGFSHLQNGFDTASPAKRSRMEIKSPGRGPPSSPLKSTPIKGKGREQPPSSPRQSSPRQSSPLDADDVEMDDWDGGVGMVDEADVDAFDLDGEDGGLLSGVQQKAEVLHVLLTNRYPNHWTKDSDQPAIQQVLHCDVDSVDSSEQRALHSALADLLTACGSTEGTADEIAILAIESLAIIATVLLNAEKFNEATTVLALLGSLVLLRPLASEHLSKLPHFQALIERSTPLLKEFTPPTGKDAAATQLSARQELIIAMLLRLADLIQLMAWVTLAPLSLPSAEILQFLLILLDMTHLPEVLHRATRVLHCLSQRSEMFRLLLATNHATSQSPLIERLCKILRDPLVLSDGAQGPAVMLGIIDSICMIAASDQDAVMLLGNGTSPLVPTLVTVLERESSYIWGLQTDPSGLDSSLTLLNHALTLLHFLVLPPPLPLHSPPIEGKPSPGVDLAHALHNASSKDFNGLPHIFIAAIGRISYAELGEGAWPPALMRGIQYLAQDLLEIVVEGPEGDSIYEVFVAEDMVMDDDDEANALAAEMDESE